MAQARHPQEQLHRIASKVFTSATGSRKPARAHLGTILVNMNTMHDCGGGYHGGADGVSLTAVGAHSRHAGQFNVRKYFQL